METKPLLKDQLLNSQRITHLATDIKRVYPAFDEKQFAKMALDKFPELELKARIAWVAESLKTYLPDNYGQALALLLASLPPHNDQTFAGSDFGIFTYAPYPAFVAAYGRDRKNLQPSLRALKEITKHFTAEDAIRYFINTYPKETFATLLKWSQDADYHVRRLASEGTRPILPWSPKIITPPEAGLPILDNLFTDNNRFVTRSVANHLNDISKKDPDLTLATLQKWQASGRQSPKEMAFIVRQSLRTLIKSGHPEAFAFLDVSTDPKVKVLDLEISKAPVIGESFTFTCALIAEADEQIIVDYILHFPNKAANGHNKKVFKFKSLALTKGQNIILSKTQPLRQLTTRKLYPGIYRLEIQINGSKRAQASFDVKSAGTP